ncbi:glycosyltransferase family protein [Bdellovibrio svalbardensis]|uniref:Glycosyl transferase family 28 C-terminal domain-containing protein n=1 Tax=Bdellovibrio svalbardensis TaxID=2972972 RepID=A0ABT6DID4_9BACT|nr:glycosyltransferase [Bdellovibrio svalbardensis]MDG0816279.1 hypothetical protein [Bdellovibrio svalbardensis]
MSLNKPRLLFYCQHLLGIGHLTRSLAISESLIKDFEVHFLQGGPDVGKSITNSSYHHHFLSPLLMKESDSSLYDPAGLKSPEQIFSERNLAIESLLQNNSFDVIVTELFPFGRNKFKTEVVNLIKAARSANPQIFVTTSVRDILVEKSNSHEREKKMAGLVQEHYDAVLVHSDERILKLEETFSLANSLQEKLYYTGFVAETPKTKTASLRRKEILVSMGGGVVGDKMVLAVLETLPHFSDYLFRVVPGPYASVELKTALKQKSEANPQLKIETFLHNFEEELSQVALSISLAGYNTVMNILNTKTPALVYPYMENIEQNLRASRMASQNLLSVIYDEDLGTANLAKIMNDRLQQPWPSFEVELNGSEKTSQYLLKNTKERIQS